MTDFILGTWIAIQLLVGFNLIFPFLLYIRFLLFHKKRNLPTKTYEADYGVIVTAYQETHMLNNVVDSLSKMKYENFVIYIVADNCDITNIHFENPKVILLNPSEVLASNVKSHLYAINHFIRQHERITIIDCDNLVDENYLNELNIYFDQGYIAVQGIREPKNLNTQIACLDAARDIYYHFYDAELLFSAGSSATLSGSGMAFETDAYLEALKGKEIHGAGFDKVLQMSLVLGGNRIAFAKKAIVLDEKTSKSDQLLNQRSRWLGTWFKYSKFGYTLLAKSVTQLDWNKFLFALTLLRPPLFMFLLFSILSMIVDVLIDPFSALIWLIGLSIFIFSFCIALIHNKAQKEIWLALTSIPNFIFYQIRSLKNLITGQKLTVSTTHVIENI